MPRSPRAAYQAGIGRLEHGVAFERLDLAPVRRSLAALRRAAPADFGARVAETEAAILGIGAGEGVA